MIRSGGSNYYTMSTATQHCCERLLIAVLIGSVAACTPDPGPPPAPEPTSPPTAGVGGGAGGRAGAGGSGGDSGSGGAGTAGAGGGAGASSGGSGGGAGVGGAGGSAGSGGATPGRDAGRASDTPGASDSGPGAAPDPAGAFPPGPHRVVLIYSTDHNGANLPAADPSLRDMVAILDGMKATHNVVAERILDDDATAANLKDRALIIVGPNVKHGSIDPAFKELAVPLIASKDLDGITRLGLGTMVNTEEFTANLPVKINIINPTHPLAADLKGTVGVLSTKCRLVRGKGLGPDAIKVATAPVEQDISWSIFAYEKGGTMAGGFKAPAKRVGFFWHRPSAATPEGKKLFIAAVEWAIRP
jgi:hypothetical protein